MKTMNAKAMGFGFSAVNAGMRNTDSEPQLIAVSTEGGFRLTPTVTKVLGIEHGDYVMFFNNINNIDDAIINNAPEVVDFCEQNGLEVGSVEAAIALHKEFDMWAIAKGIQEYDAKGNMKTTCERLSKKDKLTYVSQNFESMIDAAQEQADEETKDALFRDGITKEEQIELLTAFVTPRELPKYKGAKTANSSGMTGIGTALNFTDSNVWKQLKSDLGDDARKYNREFALDIDDIQELPVNNGNEIVVVKGIILGEYTDKEPISRSKK